MRFADFMKTTAPLPTVVTKITSTKKTRKKSSLPPPLEQGVTYFEVGDHVYYWDTDERTTGTITQIEEGPLGPTSRDRIWGNFNPGGRGWMYRQDLHLDTEVHGEDYYFNEVQSEYPVSGEVAQPYPVNPVPAALSLRDIPYPGTVDTSAWSPELRSAYNRAVISSRTVASNGV
jgi:hypothetical protein